MKREWMCVNRDGAGTGIVEAEHPGAALMACAEMWAKANCYDMDHVHEVQGNVELAADCEHCKAIVAKTAQ